MPVLTLDNTDLQLGQNERSEYVDASDYIEEANLKGHWKFNGNATDALGVNNLTENGSPVYASGQVSQAVDLEASSSQSLSITDGAQTGLDITGALSISAWIKMESLPGGSSNFIVAKSNDGAGSWAYFFDVDTTNQVRFLVSQDGSATNFAITGTTVLEVDVWYHVVGVFIPSTSIAVYVNGVRDGLNTTSPVASINDNSVAFTIGASADGSKYFDGMIDEVQIWNTDLTAAQIYELYLNGLGDGTAGGGYGFNEGKQGVNTATPITLQTDEDLTDIPQYASLEGYWRLDGKPIDRSANGNDLTATNSPTWVTGQPYASGEAVDLERGSTQRLGIADGKQQGLDITGAMTIAAWIKLESYPGAVQTIVGKYVSSGNQKSILYFVDSSGYLNLNISVNGSTDFGTAFTDIGMDTGKWYHVVCTYDPSTSVKLYINGVLVRNNTTAVPASIFNSTAAFYIGANETGSNNNFDGLVSETMIWSTDLSETEVQKVFMRGYMANAHRNGYQAIDAPALGNVYPSVVGDRELTNVYSDGGLDLPSAANVAGYWKLDEAAGQWAQPVEDTMGNLDAYTKGGVNTTTEATLGRGGDFNGTDDYLELTNAVSIKNQTKVSASV